MLFVWKGTLGQSGITHVPVMVTSTHVSKKSGKVMYTQHGYLEGKFRRTMIGGDEKKAAEVLKIDPTIPGFIKDLTVAIASSKYNRLDRAKFCRCTTDCMANKFCCRVCKAWKTLPSQMSWCL